jgi:hypothetical protein
MRLSLELQLANEGACPAASAKMAHVASLHSHEGFEMTDLILGGVVSFLSTTDWPMNLTASDPL